LFLHFLLVTVVPGCLFAGWWQVHRALSGNLLSYFYSIEWPIFAVLGVIAWWQLLHDDRSAVGKEPASLSQGLGDNKSEDGHRVARAPAVVWDRALETPELAAYNNYLRSLRAGGGRKTWGNPRGLPEAALSEQGDAAETPSQPWVAT
jgi:hypothetical protein